MPIVIGLLFILYWYQFKKTSSEIDKIIISTLIACFAFGLVMSTCFYPSLLSYQAESQVGKEITKRKIPRGMFYCYHAYSQSLEVYAQRIVPCAKEDSLSLYKKGTILFTDEKNWDMIKQNPHLYYKIIKSYDSFYVTALSISFLRRDIRPSTLEKKYLIEKY